MSQIFRFCCRCVQMSLIQDGECFICKGKFMVKSIKDDLLIRKQKHAEPHYSIYEFFLLWN